MLTVPTLIVGLAIFLPTYDATAKFVLFVGHNKRIVKPLEEIYLCSYLELAYLLLAELTLFIDSVSRKLIVIFRNVNGYNFLLSQLSFIRFCRNRHNVLETKLSSERPVYLCPREHVHLSYLPAPVSLRKELWNIGKPNRQCNERYSKNYSVYVIYTRKQNVAKDKYKEQKKSPGEPGDFVVKLQ